ncbi:non-ribosomal peptide synthetase [Jidongwangia harbinensis]|uniref:non-ribosomal peptide synthetase n=1 Tax=Jidongwangia harbinensis TaxID=2878561 RepID=UPI001CD953F1|nr:non-ribosomal peptide synthetase [Jidongwangia harbinensis]MCA2218363.1 amino acid adenylation domain-containing protein [Jidongwangia harbinensis]
MRANLSTHTPHHHTLTITLHHTIADAWSVTVLANELQAHYQGIPLPAPAVQYADHTRWQQSRVDLTAELRHWAAVLADLAVQDLPTDHARRDTGDAPAARHYFRLPPALSDRVTDFGRQAEATPFMVVLAALQTVLTHHTGQTDIAIATPTAGRHHPDLDHTIGYFANTLVLRTHTNHNPTFHQLLNRTRTTCLTAYHHDTTPFEHIVETLNPHRDPTRHPLTQTMLAWQNAPVAALRIDGLELEVLPAENGTAQFDLSFVLAEDDGGIGGYLEYRSDLFDQATARRFAAHLTAVLATALNDPQRRVAELVPMTPAERHDLLVSWNGTATVPDSPDVADLVARAASADPDATAVTADRRQWSYAELERGANRLAHRLVELGAGPERLVGLLLEPGAPMVVAMLAVLRSGAAYLPLDPGGPAARRTDLLAEARPAVLLTTAALAGRVPTGAGCPVLRLDADATTIDRQPDTAPAHTGGPDNLAYVMYTSGSTGRPKGVAISRHSLARLLATARDWVTSGPGDVWTVLHSYAFDLSVWEIWAALTTGGRLIVVPPEVGQDGARLLRLLADERVTMLNITPSAFRYLESADAAAPAGLALRHIMFAGEAVDLATVTAWFARRGDRTPRLHTMYGPTEATVHATSYPLGERDLGADRTPIGRPLRDLGVHVLDSAGRLAPVGAVGDLHLGGAALARGYLGGPALTADRFRPDPFGGRPGARLYRTGDLARWRTDGVLEFHGRVDDQVQIRGVRIEPGEVRAELARLPGVAQAAVVARLEADGDHRLIGYVVPVRGGALDPAELRRRLADVLPSHLVPAVLVILDALPLTRNGKLDRAALPAPRPADPPPVAPRSPVGAASGAQQVLAHLWAEVLGVPEVGPEDDFFDLSGHSLAAARLLAKVRAVFDVDLPIRVLFDAPTVNGLLTEIDRARRAVLPTPRPRPAGQVVPLSWAQQRLWFLDQLHPGSTAYNIPITIAIDGPLDTHRLTHALNTTIQRHEALRTTIDPTTEPPTQHIHPHRPTTITTHPDPPTPQPFDLTTGPLLRANLSTHTPHHHTLTITLHHTIADAWSVTVLIQELVAHYQGRSLPVPALQYADHTHWQQTHLDLTAELRHWATTLADLPVLRIPTDRPRSDWDDRGATVELPLPDHVRTGVEQLARKSGSTPFMVVLAALQTVLTHHTGQTDIAIATPTAGRHHPDLDHTIGYFANTLVLRTHTNHNPTFHQLLNRTRTTCLTAYHHDTTPFEHIVETLNPHRDPTRHPLTQTMLAWQEPPAVPAEVDGLRLTPLDPPVTTAKFDLLFSVTELPQEWLAGLSYRTALFDRATAQRLLANLRQVLEQAIADPDRPIGDLDALTAADHALSADAGTGSAQRHPTHRTVAELFTEQAARTPGAVAVTAAAGALTYADLDRRTNQLARYLRSRGVGPETRVGVAGDRGLDLVVSLLAVLKAGGCYVPLDPANPPARRQRIARDAGVALVLDGTGADWPELAVVDPAAETVTAQDDGDLTPSAGPDNLAYVLYTSGSTGTPKGVMISNAALTNHMCWMARRWPLTPADRVLQKTPIGFDASVWEFYAPLLAGAGLVLAEPDGHRDNAYLVDAIRTHDITVLQVVPSLLDVLLDTPGFGTASPLRRVFSGGEALTPRLRDAFLDAMDADLVNLYGPAECCVDSTSADCRDSHGSPVVPIGRPIDNARAYVLGPRLRPVPPGAPGELYLAGPGLGRGYLGRPDLTAERFLPDPFAAEPGSRMYATGDLARVTGDGHLEHLGRIDRQLTLHGHRIEPAEIEAVLARHPAVRRVAVTADLTAHVVPRSGRSIELADLHRHAAGELPAYLRPTGIRRHDELPLTPNGKVDHAALTGLAAETPEVRGEAPRGPAEEAVAEAYASVLGRPVGDRNANFFHSGGNSLLAMRVVARLAAAGHPVALQQVFTHPTPAELAGVLGGDGTDRIPAVPAGRPVPATHAQRRIWFLHQVRPDRTDHHIPTVVRLRGPLDPAALRRAFAELVVRHEPLRTGFAYRDGALWQVPGDPAGPDLPVEDVGGPDAADAAVRESVDRPFDLAAGPLLRARLLRTRPDDHLLIAVLQHIAVDGWSIGILLRDLAELYAAARDGRAARLPELPVRYADYAAWQAGRSAPGQLQESLTYWPERLAGLGAPGLPKRIPVPAATADRPGASVPLDIERELRDAVFALAASAGTTPFAVLLGVLALVLARRTGRPDICIGTDVADRDRPELADLAGLFLNQVPLRMDVSGVTTFRALLGRAATTSREALAHSQVPFDRIVDAARAGRAPGAAATPLFSVLLGYEEGGLPDRFGDLAAEFTELPAGTTKLDLTLFTWNGSGGLTGRLQYATDVLDHDEARTLRDDLLRTLRTVTADPDAPLTPTIPSSSAPGGRAMAPVPSPRFRRVTPRPVPVADTGLIRTGEVIPGSRLPLLATPESAGVDLTGWLASRPDWLPPRLAEHGAVLFRGFGVHEPASFERLAGTVCGDLLDANGEHVPVLANGRVQTPVFFPADRRLLWHNENSFNDRWPALIVFCSTMPAASGGETPLVDSRRVYAELSPAIRERFLATGVRYHRSYGGGVGLDWAKVFGTDDRAEVERACRDAGLRYEWQPGNRLRTTCVRPAVVEHPVTGEPSWFTQAQHWHPACLDPVTRTAMTALYGPEDLPRNCTYGDGEPIPDEVMTEILGVYERLEVSFAWQRGDVLVVDNVLTAHGRNPYQGERRLLVALGRETAYPETAGAGTSGTGSPR